MTLMSPQDFHELFDRAVADGPPSAHDDVAAGRRLLRRRRLASSAVVCAAVVAVTGGYALLGAPDGPAEGRDVAGRPAKSASTAEDAAWIEACRAGQIAPAARAALFEGGNPVVRAREVNDVQVALALESADGSHWAECTVSRSPGADAGASVRTYESGVQGPVSSGPVATTARVCPPGAGGAAECRTFTLTWVDRLPPDVAGVRFTTADGRETVVRSRDGYVLLNLLTTLPPSSNDEPLSVLRRIVYLDEAGAPIAGEDRLTDGGTVDGLPHLSAYPSWRGAQVPEPGPS